MDDACNEAAGINALPKDAKHLSLGTGKVQTHNLKIKKHAPCVSIDF